MIILSEERVRAMTWHKGTPLNTKGKSLD